MSDDPPPPVKCEGPEGKMHDPGTKVCFGSVCKTCLPDGTWNEGVKEGCAPGAEGDTCGD